MIIQLDSTRYSQIFRDLAFRVPKDYFSTLSSYPSLNNSTQTNNQQNNSLNSTFLSIWPTNRICETNDDYESYENIHQQVEQQPILNHQEEGEQGENKSYYNQINYLGTRQMGDNINTNNEQRQFNGGGANNTNLANRKKTNNGKREKQINF